MTTARAIISPRRPEVEHNSESVRYDVGEAVEARFKRGRNWFGARVVAVYRSDNSYDLRFDDGDEESGVSALMMKRKPQPAVSYQIDDRVEARYRGGEAWHPARVAKIHAEDGSLDLNYLDGDRETRVAPRLVRVPIATAKEKQESPVEDDGERYFVGDAVEGRFGGGEKWHPAVIDRCHADGKYDLKYDDGDAESRVRSTLIREKAVERRRKPRDDDSEDDRRRPKNKKDVEDESEEEVLLSELEDRLMREDVSLISASDRRELRGWALRERKRLHAAFEALEEERVSVREWREVAKDAGGLSSKLRRSLEAVLDACGSSKVAWAEIFDFVALPPETEKIVSLRHRLSATIVRHFARDLVEATEPRGGVCDFADLERALLNKDSRLLDGEELGKRDFRELKAHFGRRVDLNAFCRWIQKPSGKSSVERASMAKLASGLNQLKALEKKEPQKWFRKTFDDDSSGTASHFDVRSGLIAGLSLPLTHWEVDTLLEEHEDGKRVDYAKLLRGSSDDEKKSRASLLWKRTFGGKQDEEEDEDDEELSLISAKSAKILKKKSEVLAAEVKESSSASGLKKALRKLGLETADEERLLQALDLLSKKRGDLLDFALDFCGGADEELTELSDLGYSKLRKREISRDEAIAAFEKKKHFSREDFTAVLARRPFNYEGSQVDALARHFTVSSSRLMKKTVDFNAFARWLTADSALAKAKLGRSMRCLPKRRLQAALKKMSRDNSTSSNSDKVRVDDLWQLVKTCRFPLSEGEVRSLALRYPTLEALLDEAATSMLLASSLQSKLAEWASGLGRNGLRRLFLELDRNDNGFLDAREVRRMLQKAKLKVDDEEMDGLLELLDSDGDGTVDYAEFLDFVLSFEEEEDDELDKLQRKLHALLEDDDHLRRALKKKKRIDVTKVLSKELNCDFTKPERRSLEKRFCDEGDCDVEALIAWLCVDVRRVAQRVSRGLALYKRKVGDYHTVFRDLLNDSRDLTPTSLYSGLRRELGLPVTRAETAVLFEAFDVDDSGTLELDEFLQLAKSGAKIPEKKKRKQERRSLSPSPSDDEKKRKQEKKKRRSPSPSSSDDDKKRKQGRRSRSPSSDDDKERKQERRGRSPSSDDKSDASRRRRPASDSDSDSDIKRRGKKEKKRSIFSSMTRKKQDDSASSSDSASSDREEEEEEEEWGEGALVGPRLRKAIARWAAKEEDPAAFFADTDRLKTSKFIRILRSALPDEDLEAMTSCLEDDGSVDYVGFARFAERISKGLDSTKLRKLRGEIRAQLIQRKTKKKFFSSSSSLDVCAVLSALDKDKEGTIEASRSFKKALLKLNLELDRGDPSVLAKRFKKQGLVDYVAFARWLGVDAAGAGFLGREQGRSEDVHEALLLNTSRKLRTGLRLLDEPFLAHFKKKKKKLRRFDVLRRFRGLGLPIAVEELDWVLDSIAVDDHVSYSDLEKLLEEEEDRSVRKEEKKKKIKEHSKEEEEHHHSGTVDVASASRKLRRALRAADEGELAEAFAAMDEDGSSEVDSVELAKWLDERFKGLELSERDYSALFASSLDTDANGKISASEFYAWAFEPPRGRELGVVAQRIRAALGLEGCRSLREACQRKDRKRRGSVPSSYFVEALDVSSSTRIDLSRDELSELLRRFGSDNQVRYVQLCAWLEAGLSENALAVLRSKLRRLKNVDARTVFRDAVGKSGKLGVEELALCCERLGVQLGEVALAALMKTFDADGDGAVDFGEFTSLVLDHKKQDDDLFSCFSSDGELTTVLETIFTAFDVNGDDKMEKSELKRVCPHVLRAFSLEPNTAELRSFEKRIKTALGGSKFMSYAQFESASLDHVRSSLAARASSSAFRKSTIAQLKASMGALSEEGFVALADFEDLCTVGHMAALTREEAGALAQVCAGAGLEALEEQHTKRERSSSPRKKKKKKPTVDVGEVIRLVKAAQNGPDAALAAVEGAPFSTIKKSKEGTAATAVMKLLSGPRPDPTRYLFAFGGSKLPESFREASLAKISTRTLSSAVDASSVARHKKEQQRAVTVTLLDATAVPAPATLYEGGLGSRVERCARVCLVRQGSKVYDETLVSNILNIPAHPQPYKPDCWAFSGQLDGEDLSEETRQLERRKHQLRQQRQPEILKALTEAHTKASSVVAMAPTTDGEGASLLIELAIKLPRAFFDRISRDNMSRDKPRRERQRGRRKSDNSSDDGTDDEDAISEDSDDYGLRRRKKKKKKKKKQGKAASSRRKKNSSSDDDDDDDSDDSRGSSRKKKKEKKKRRSDSGSDEEMFSDGSDDSGRRRKAKREKRPEWFGKKQKKKQTSGDDDDDWGQEDDEDDGLLLDAVEVSCGWAVVPLDSSRGVVTLDLKGGSPFAEAAIDVGDIPWRHRGWQRQLSQLVFNYDKRPRLRVRLSHGLKDLDLPPTALIPERSAPLVSTYLRYLEDYLSRHSSNSLLISSVIADPVLALFPRLIDAPHSELALECLFALRRREQLAKPAPPLREATRALAAQAALQIAVVELWQHEAGAHGGKISNKTASSPSKVALKAIDLLDRAGLLDQLGDDDEASGLDDEQPSRIKKQHLPAAPFSTDELIPQLLLL